MPGLTDRRRSRARRSDRTRRSRIGVLVALQARLDREALLALLGTRPELRVLGGAATLSETLVLCLAKRPRVLLLSAMLDGAREAPASAVLRQEVPGTRIVAIAPHAADRCVLLNPAVAVVSRGGDASRRLTDGRQTCIDAALAQGALRVVTRDASAADLFAVIRAAADAPPRAAIGLPPDPAPAHALTRQETRVALRVGEGRSNKEIAAALRISDLTVKKHLGHALHKLGLNDRLQLGLCVARHPLAFRDEPPARGPDAALRPRHGARSSTRTRTS